MIALANILTTLREIAGGAERERAIELLQRTADRRLRILVAGEAKRGKSTLVNRLIGRDVLPTGVLPVTAVSTTVRFGASAEGLQIHFTDGRVEAHSVGDLAAFVTEDANPQNRRGVVDAVLSLPDGPLAAYPVELVDTPGTGSVFEHNTRTAHDSYAGLDAVIMVVGASPPIGAAEQATLGSLATTAVRVFVVLNKIDHLAPDEVTQTVEFTAAACRAAGLIEPRVYPASARDGDDPGFEIFRTEFVSYLTERADTDAEAALRGHARRLAQRVRDGFRLELRATTLAREQDTAELASFSAQLHTLLTRASELSDRCAATARRLRAALDDSARALGAELTAHCASAHRDRLSARPQTDAAEIRHASRQLVQQIVTDAVVTWRGDQAAAAEREFARLVDSIEQDRAGHLDLLRRRAAEDLGLELAAPFEPLPLATGRTFWLDFTEPPAVELPGADLLRRRGPGAAHRARRQIEQEIPWLVDRQVGRARADVQARIDETARQLAHALHAHHVATIQTVRDMVDRVAAEHEAGRPARAERVAGLQARARRCDALLQALDAAQPDSPPAGDPASGSANVAAYRSSP